MPKLHCFIVLLLLLFSGETYSQTTRNLQAPVLYMPQDKAVFTKDQVQAIIFRWRPVFPPTDDVTYHIRVFEVLPEQSPMQALRTNYPLVEEEVEQSFWIWTPDILLSDEEHQFVWQVQAFDASGFTLGEPDGLSSPFTFTVTKPALMDVSLKNYLLRNNFAATATNFDIVMKLNP